MTLRTSMLRVEDILTNLLLPSVLDQVPHQVTIITRTWAGGEVGMTDQGYTDTSLVMPKKFPVRQLTTNEISGSDGNYEMGDIIVELIVPNDVANPGVGYTVAQLAPPALSSGVEVIYQLTGQHNGNYKRIELRTSDPYEYKFVLRRDVTQPEVT